MEFICMMVWVEVRSWWDWVGFEDLDGGIGLALKIWMLLFDKQFNNL